MKCIRVDRIELAPDARIWTAQPVTAIDMVATPPGLQPTAYIQNSWADRPYGRITPLRVAAIHDGEMLAIRLSWKPVGGGNPDFPDAAAIALPVSGDPVLGLMGAPDAPIHLLRWQTHHDGGELIRSILAEGIGSTRPGPEIKRRVGVRRHDGLIDIVIARTLGQGAGAAPLLAGKTTKIGFAVWDGGNEERAGIKAFSGDWIDLALDA